MPTVTPQQEAKTQELTNMLDQVCSGFQKNEVKDALLTLVVWWMADACLKHELPDPDALVDAVTGSLKAALRLAIENKRRGQDV